VQFGAPELFWKFDRFGRSSLDVLSNIRTLTDAGVRLIAVTQGWYAHSDGRLSVPRYSAL